MSECGTCDPVSRPASQIERLTNQLRESAAHVEQMEAERVQLQQLLDTASHDLQTKSRDLDSAHSELHTAQMTNGRLEQQVHAHTCTCIQHVHVHRTTCTMSLHVLVCRYQIWSLRCRHLMSRFQAALN